MDGSEKILIRINKITKFTLFYRTEKCMLQFPAHMEPIYTCDWHPTQNWLATGSRDKQIKVCYWKLNANYWLTLRLFYISVAIDLEYGGKSFLGTYNTHNSGCGPCQMASRKNVNFTTFHIVVFF